MGEVAKEFKSGNSLKADEIGITGDYPVYGGNGLRGYTSTYNHDGEFALIGRQGALCGNMNYSVGKAYFTEHAVVVKADENNDTKFMYYMLDTMNLGQYSDQSAQPGLAVNKLVKLENLFPQKEEQQRIGLYFSNVDHLITLHQRELYLFVKRESFAWEQRKLGDWGTFYYGRSCPKWSVTEDATIPCIRYGELYTKFGAKIDKVYSYTNMSPESLRFSKGTEVLIPRVGEDPMDYNHCTWLSMPDVAIGEMISVFNTENNPLFTATMFNATLQNEFAMRVEGGSVTNLYFEKLKNIDVLFPSLEEQEKIATYFDSLDHLITLHQRKCDQTKKLKKFMLQKMFPQNGKKVPELRFSEFTDDWEQRKLGEYAEIVGGGTPSTKVSAYWDGDINWYAPAEILDQIYLSSSQRKITEQGLNRSSAKMLPVGTVLFTSRAGIGKTAILSHVACTNQGFQSIVPHDGKLDSYFIYSRTDELKKYAETVGAGSTFVEVSGKQMSNMELMMPKTIKEQQVIGNYFRKIDNLITLHQREHIRAEYILKYIIYSKGEGENGRIRKNNRRKINRSIGLW